MAASKQKVPWKHTFYGKRMQFVKTGPKPRLTERQKDFVRPYETPPDLLNIARCPICNKSVTFLTQHLQRIHKVNPDRHQCPFCTVSTTRSDNLQRHMETLHPGLLAEMEPVSKDLKPKKTCEICFKRYVDLKGHRRKVHNPNEEGKIFQCKYCPAFFKRMKTLEIHSKRSHSGQSIADNLLLSAKNAAEGQKKDTCPVCNLRILRSDFRQHLKWHGRNGPVPGEKPRKYPCEVCGFRFLTKQHLTAHGKVHAKKPETVLVGRGPRNQLGTRHWLCAVCGCRFRRKQHLQNHLKTHQKDPTAPENHEGRRQCNICKGWQLPNNLPRHIRAHSNTRLFVCPQDFCNKRYSRKADLEKHKLICKATRIKQRKNLIGDRVGTKIKCLRCRKLIPSKDFTNHRRVHFGERNYRCKLCPKTFTKRDRLNSHELTHSKNRKLYPCPLYSCDFKCKTKQGLAYHLLHSSDCRNGYLGEHSKLLKWKSQQKNVPDKVILVDYPDSEDDNEPRKNTFPSIEELC